MRRLGSLSLCVSTLLASAVLGSCDSSGPKSCEEGGDCACTGGLKDGACPADASGDARATSDAGQGSLTVEGRVFSSSDGQPLAGVEVSVGELRVQTDDTGSFLLRRDADGSLGLARDGFASTSKALPAKAAYVELFMARVSASGEFAVQSGGRARGDDGLSLEVPADSVRRPDGGEIRGAVQAQVTSVRAENARELETLPGNFEAELKGQTGRLQVRTPVDVTLRDADGELEVAAERSLLVDLPIRRADAPQEVPLWSYDETRRSWRSEGTAVRTTSDSGASVYRARVTHLSWWTTGDFLAQESLTCVRACATDAAGQPLVGASATVTGIDHNSQTSGPLDEQGCFAAEVKASAQIAVTVKSQSGNVPAAVFTTSAEPMRSADDPTACQVLTLGGFTAADEGSTCPVGLSLCDAQCADLRSDGDNCGSCATACGGEAGREKSCLEGLCQCPLGYRDCGGDRCANVRADRAHCGACDKACADTEECVDGVCEPTPCPTGLARCAGDCVEMSDHDLHCGSCEVVCAEGEECSGSVCMVPSDPSMDAGVPDAGSDAGATDCGALMDCGGSCVDVQADGMHCGACDEVCGLVQNCLLGVCSGCGDGTLDVNRVCAQGGGACAVDADCVGTGNFCGPEECDDGNNTDGDGCSAECRLEVCTPMTCGDLGAMCGAHDDGCGGMFSCGTCPANRTCDVSGTCVCDIDLTDCVGNCVDLNTDDNNCGGCGMSCAGGTCAAGVCQSNCGNSTIEVGEDCDDGNAVGGDGCSASCIVEPGYTCSSPATPCTLCGDGIVEAVEACDDGNAVGGDGCSADCNLVEAGYTCAVPGTACSFCGDGVLDGAEACDDGNTLSGDGCAADCSMTEGGYWCPTPGAPCQVI